MKPTDNPDSKWFEKVSVADGGYCTHGYDLTEYTCETLSPGGSYPHPKTMREAVGAQGMEPAPLPVAEQVKQEHARRYPLGCRERLIDCCEECLDRIGRAAGHDVREVKPTDAR